MLSVVVGVVLRSGPGPVPVFSLTDLEDVYAGMVRSDGRNEASVIHRQRLFEEPGHIVPATCQPLFEATVLNQMPDEALDGVGTFWELNGSAVSLFTYRFSDVATADREFERLARAFDNCREAPVEIHARPAVKGLLRGMPAGATEGSARGLAYVLTSDDETKLAVHVLALSNTLTWQFRYEPLPGEYVPLTAERVMQSLTDQMNAILADLATRER